MDFVLIVMLFFKGYRQNWKAANNHFQRYSDVKPREERRPTVMDLANQAHVGQKANGWRIYHLSSQMEDLVIFYEFFDKNINYFLSVSV